MGGLARGLNSAHDTVELVTNEGTPSPLGGDPSWMAPGTNTWYLPLYGLLKQVSEAYVTPAFSFLYSLASGNLHERFNVST